MKSCTIKIVLCIKILLTLQKEIKDINIIDRLKQLSIIIKTAKLIRENLELFFKGYEDELIILFSSSYFSFQEKYIIYNNCRTLTIVVNMLMELYLDVKNDVKVYNDNNSEINRKYTSDLTIKLNDSVSSIDKSTGSLNNDSFINEVC